MDDIFQTLIAAKTAIVLVWFVFWLIAEHVWPVAAAPHGRTAVRRWVKNGALFGINTILSPLIVLPLTVFAAQQGGPFDLDWRPEAAALAPAALALALLIDILLLDAFIYAWHRANHEIPFLWRFHQVHHRDQHLDASSAVRFHFGEVVMSAVVRAAVIVALDMPLTSVVVFEIAVLLSAIFHHSNIRLPARVERALSFVVITPSIHWVHHHAVRRDTDSNYGTIFSFWDRLFHSRSDTPRSADMPIGVERETDQGLKELLVLPFRNEHQNPNA